VKADGARTEIGVEAPDFELPLLDSERTIRLSDLRGKPVVLLFGSATCGPFTKGLSKANLLHDEFGDRIHFYVVYTREEHPEHDAKLGRYLSQPSSMEERATNARTCRVTRSVSMPILLDTMDDAVSRAYAGSPNRVYLIGEDGRIVFRDKPGPVVGLFALNGAIQRALQQEAPSQFQGLAAKGPVSREDAALRLEAIAAGLRAGRFAYEAGDEMVAFDIPGKQVVFEIEADYNPAKKKYSIELDIAWRPEESSP
jgi:amphi-Trp domain-containing protein